MINELIILDQIYVQMELQVLINFQILEIKIVSKETKVEVHVNVTKCGQMTIEIYSICDLKALKSQIKIFQGFIIETAV